MATWNGRRGIAGACLAAALLVGGHSACATENKPAEPNRVERTAKKAAAATERGAKHAVEAVERAAKKTDKALNHAAEKTENWVKQKTK